MFMKQNSRKILSVNITALSADGEIADTDMSLKDFIIYMNDLTEESCNNFETFTATFLGFKYSPSEQSDSVLP